MWAKSVNDRYFAPAVASLPRPQRAVLEFLLGVGVVSIAARVANDAVGCGNFVTVATLLLGGDITFCNNQCGQRIVRAIRFPAPISGVQHEQQCVRASCVRHEKAIGHQ